MPQALQCSPAGGLVFRNFNASARAACASLSRWPTTSAVEEFLEYVIRQLIEFPEEMVLTKLEAPKKVTFRLQLRQSDIGKVIGKHGHTVDAIRNLLSAAAARHGQRVTLHIVEDPGVERSGPAPASQEPV